MGTGETRVRQIFGEASELAPGERAGFLQLTCAGNLELHGAVERLLAALDDAGDFLVPKADAPVALVPGQEAPGTRIGPYRLLEQIGEGGFGAVFVAEQEAPVVRRVAIKVIKLGMDTRQVVARFQAERQALALMDHPNIARVFDAGATELGRPYFVMEYVRGEPITEYCDRRQLSISDRLELFLDVCGAIQHAHQKGVIHRDIKPANILVSSSDGRPSPKVIDFGIAKATNARLTEKTLFTDQHQLIGTPQYMSPEQADPNEGDFDTRSDIYSLGVLLYELLTGTTPLDLERLRASAFAEIQRIIRDEEPPMPSTRVGTLGVEQEAIAARRRSEPAQLARLVRGDLDWIVMKALEKERERRYESAGSLARDIERHLVDEPVSAGPPSRLYRVRKFVRRNRGMVVASAIILAALIVGIIGTSGGMVWALKERGRAAQARDAASEQGRIATLNEARAQLEATHAKTVLAVLQAILQPAQTQDERGNPLPFLERVQRASNSLGEELRAQPEIEAQVRSILGSTFATFEAYSAAEQEYARALELERRLHGDSAPSVERAIVDLARTIARGGDPARAAQVVSAALEQFGASGPADSPNVARLLYTLSDIQLSAADPAAAESSAKQALAMRERLGGHQQPPVAESLAQLGRIAARARRWEDAKTRLGESVALSRALEGELQPDTAARLFELAEVLRRSGDVAGAIALLRASVESSRGALSSKIPTDEERLGLALQLTQLSTLLGCEPGHWDEMEAVALDALAIQRELRVVDSLACSDTLNELGNLYWFQGRLEQAAAMFRESLALRRTRDDEQYRRRAAGAANMLSIVTCELGDLAVAESLAREAHAACLWYNRGPAWTVWVSGYELALIVRLRGDDGNAQRIERELAAMIPLAPAHLSLGTAMRLERIGEALAAAAHADLAEPVLAECERIMKELGTLHWVHDAANCSLAMCCAARAKFRDGHALLSSSVEALRANSEVPPARMRRALRQAVDFHAAWGAAGPGKDHESETEAWRARLAEHDARDVPARAWKR